MCVLLFCRLDCINRYKTSWPPVEKFILNLSIYILRLRICILKLRICILSLRINFYQSINELQKLCGISNL